jgi:hypothetical protein
MTGRLWGGRSARPNRALLRLIRTPAFTGAALRPGM